MTAALSCRASASISAWAPPRPSGCTAPARYAFGDRCALSFREGDWRLKMERVRVARHPPPPSSAVVAGHGGCQVTPEEYILNVDDTICAAGEQLGAMSNFQRSSSAGDPEQQAGHSQPDRVPLRAKRASVLAMS